MNRRNFIAAGLAGGISGLAGCESPSGNTNETGEESDLNIAWPEVSSSQISNWVRTGNRKETYSESKWGVEVTGFERTYIYENQAIRNSLKEKTLGNFDQTLATFFATHIDLRGYATAFVSKEKIAEQVVPSFEDELSDQGIQNVTQIGPKNPLPNVGGKKGAVIYEYEGRYPVPEFTKKVDIEDIGERELTIPSGHLAITGLLAVWKNGNGTGYVAGGAFPADDYEEQDTITITSEEGDGIDTIVKVDLNISPRRIRSEIINLIESVK